MNNLENNMSAKLEVDMAVDLTEDSKMPSDWAKTFDECGVTYEIIDPHGPGGGWPFIRVSGQRENIEKWVRTHYAPNPSSDPDTYVEMIQNV